MYLQDTLQVLCDCTRRAQSKLQGKNVDSAKEMTQPNVLPLHRLYPTDNDLNEAEI